MTKFIVLFTMSIVIIGCAGTTAQSRSTTPTAEVRPGTTVISTEEYARLQQRSQERDQLITSQISDEERATALNHYVATHRPQEVDEPATPAPATRSPEESLQALEAARNAQSAPPAPRPAPQTAPPAPQAAARPATSRQGFASPMPPTSSGSYAPPGMVTQTQAYAGGSAPWQRYGGQTGGQAFTIQVNSEYAIAIAIDGQMVQPIAGGMPLMVPAYTGGGISQVPVIPATRAGGWTGTQTTRDYQMLADAPGRHQISWTCYSVVSGRAGRLAGQGVRTLNVRAGTRFLINGSMCR